jgi:hypothetical protein
MTFSERMVEAMAQSLWAEFHRQKPERFPFSCPNPQRWRDLARAAIRAVTASGGLVVGKMPFDVVFPDDASEDTGPYARGHNGALAAVRANAVTGEEV